MVRFSFCLCESLSGLRLLGPSASQVGADPIKMLIGLLQERLETSGASDTSLGNKVTKQDHGSATPGNKTPTRVEVVESTPEQTVYKKRKVAESLPDRQPDTPEDTLVMSPSQIPDDPESPELTERNDTQPASVAPTVPVGTLASVPPAQPSNTDVTNVNQGTSSDSGLLVNSSTHRKECAKLALNSVSSYLVETMCFNLET